MKQFWKLACSGGYTNLNAVAIQLNTELYAYIAPMSVTWI